MLNMHINRLFTWTLTIIFLFLASSLVVANDDATGVKHLKKPIQFDAAEEDISNALRREFDVIHEIFLITSDKDRIVVGDRSFSIADGVRINGLRKGMFVGLKLNDEKKVVAIERLDRSN